jgi:diaminohydroxyphosphoribosylaminopyrimidine deaminase/5-amino-6-(5-phosphoribosylamino)uracil reductase
MKSDLLDKKYMKLAIELAKKGVGRTNPNPAVGAVIVKNRRVIASAYHKKAGLLHAEALAIKKAGKAAHGATLYSTLEACTHYGKTPPCVDAIFKSGIKRAVFAMKDPNPINYGCGIAKLRKAGVKTECGLLRKAASDLNRPFIKFMRSHLPYVTIKMAQSVDGKIADAKGRSKWITSTYSRQFVHKLRVQNDAVMIGINTLLKDDPVLTSRVYEKVGRQPLRIVLDSNLCTPLQSRIVRTSRDKGGDVLIAGGNGASPKKKILLEKNGVKVILLPRKNNHVSLISLMRYLAKIGVMSVLCEGGGEVAASLLKEKLVDEIFFFISPCIIGGRKSPTSCGGVDSDIRRSIRLKNIKIERFGPDILIRGDI